MLLWEAFNEVHSGWYKLHKNWMPCIYCRNSNEIIIHGFMKIFHSTAHKGYISHCHDLRWRAMIFHLLWPCDTIWRQMCWLILAQVMACCLTAPSHYLNQCWLAIAMSSSNHLRAVSIEMPQLWVIKTSLKMTYLKFYGNLPGANELAAVDSWT